MDKWIQHSRFLKKKSVYKSTVGVIKVYSWLCLTKLCYRKRTIQVLIQWILWEMFRYIEFVRTANINNDGAWKKSNILVNRSRVVEFLIPVTWFFATHRWHAAKCWLTSLLKIISSFPIWLSNTLTVRPVIHNKSLYIPFPPFPSGLRY